MVKLDSSILEIVRELNPRIAGQVIESDTNLLDCGALDSALMVQLVLRLEDKFSIKFEFEDMRQESFRDLASIRNLLTAKYKVQVA